MPGMRKCICNCSDAQVKTADSWGSLANQPSQRAKPISLWMALSLWQGSGQISKEVDGVPEQDT